MLPRGLDWTIVLLVACAPQLLAFALLPAVVPRLPRPVDRQTVTVAVRAPRTTGIMVPLAFAAGSAIAITYSSLEQLTIPLRSRREFGLDRTAIARLFMLMQACDIAALIPVGFIADRTGPVRVLAGVSFVLAVGSILIGFGSLSGMAIGVILFGVGLAGWMTPLGVLRQETPPAQVAWRTGLYRACVDACTFIGPLLGGLFAGRHLIGATFALVVIGICLFRTGRRTPPPVFEPRA
jgi:MFS family permease